MMARWKDNFMNFNLEGCFKYMFYSASKRKTVEDDAATRTGWKSMVTL
jgi:hypothetical protein